MLKENELIGPSPSTAKRCARSPTSRSSWSRTSPRRRHRHREHAAAQRAAQRTDDLRVAAAADRHRRRAQGHQPLDLRSADGARYAGRSRRHGCARPTWRIIVRRVDGVYYRASPAMAFAPNSRTHTQLASVHRRRIGRSSDARCSKAGPFTSPMSLADPDYTFSDAVKLGGIRTVLGVPLLREGTPIGVSCLPRTTCRPVHRQADRAGRPPSPTRR